MTKKNLFECRRLRLKLRKKQLAARLRVPPQTYHDWQSGRRGVNPRFLNFLVLDLLVRLADEKGIDAALAIVDAAGLEYDGAYPPLAPKGGPQDGRKRV